jgi:hypothetical protein
MKPALTLSVIWLALAVTLTGVSAGTGLAPTRADVLRRVFFSAVDSKGAPVDDLTAADLTVKEGGKERPIDAVQPATRPMQLSIIVDDGGTGGFQAAVGQFIQATFARAEFALRVLKPQAIKVMDFTRNGDDLRAALGHLGQRGRIPNDGEQIIAGVTDAAKELEERKAGRPSIVVLTVTGEKALSDQSDEAMGALKSSGASLSVVYLTGINLGKVLGDGPKQSGGTIEQVNGNVALGPAMARIADTLLHQYMLTYTIPDGVKLNEKLSLSTTRKDVKLLAPTRIPDK